MALPVLFFLGCSSHDIRDERPCRRDVPKIEVPLFKPPYSLTWSVGYLLEIWYMLPVDALTN